MRVAGEPGHVQRGQREQRDAGTVGVQREAEHLLEIGQTVAGVVRSVEDYGIFVELAPNLAGLAELKDGVVAGQTAAVYIKNIIPERMKIKLVIIDKILSL